MHADRQRLDHRRLGEGDVVGQLEGEELGMDDRRAQDAVDRRRRPEAHGRVEIVDAEARGAAVRVGDARLHADAVADLERRDRGADLDHDAGRLVAEDHRLADDERADAAMGVVVDVGAADADGVQLDAHVVRARASPRARSGSRGARACASLRAPALSRLSSFSRSAPADDEDAEREHEDVADPERDRRLEEAHPEQLQATPM